MIRKRTKLPASIILIFSIIVASFCLTIPTEAVTHTCKVYTEPCPDGEHIARFCMNDIGGPLLCSQQFDCPGVWTECPGVGNE